MRLLFAHDHRFRRTPGGEVYTPSSFPASFWDRYLEHFDAVHVLARDGGLISEGARLARSDRDRVKFEFVPSLASLRQLVRPSPDVNRQVRAAVASVDAVVVRLPSELGLLALRHARSLDKPYAIEVVGCAWDSCVNSGTLGARLYAPLAFVRNRRAIAIAPLALYVTSSWLQQRYPTVGQMESASNVSLVPMDEAGRKHRAVRLAALARGERPVLGTIASLQTKWKGIQTALAALSQLHAEGLELNYRVLGPGPIEPWKELAESLGIGHLVHFDGTRSAGEDVCDWLDDIDIHLQPSFQEGLPRATIEAMSRGAACIGSTCGGIPELLPPDRVHRPGDIRGLADRIRHLATDPAAIADASESDRETARRFDPGKLRAKRSAFFGRLRTLAEQEAKASAGTRPVCNDAAGCHGRPA